VITINLTVKPCPDDDSFYTAYWPDGDVQLDNIPEIWVDLIPFMIARKLLSQGCNPERLFIVRLEGADFDLMRAPLGAAAATPLVNTEEPVWQSTRHVYRGARHA